MDDWDGIERRDNPDKLERIESYVVQTLSEVSALKEHVRTLNDRTGDLENEQKALSGRLSKITGGIIVVAFFITSAIAAAQIFLK